MVVECRIGSERVEGRGEEKVRGRVERGLKRGSIEEEHLEGLIGFVEKRKAVHAISESHCQLTTRKAVRKE